MVELCVEEVDRLVESIGGGDGGSRDEYGDRSGDPVEETPFAAEEKSGGGDALRGGGEEKLGVGLLANLGMGVVGGYGQEEILTVKKAWVLVVVMDQKSIFYIFYF